MWLRVLISARVWPTIGSARSERPATVTRTEGKQRRKQAAAKLPATPLPIIGRTDRTQTGRRKQPLVCVLEQDLFDDASSDVGEPFEASRVEEGQLVLVKTHQAQ